MSLTQLLPLQHGWDLDTHVEAWLATKLANMYPHVFHFPRNPRRVPIKFMMYPEEILYNKCKATSAINTSFNVPVSVHVFSIGNKFGISKQHNIWNSLIFSWAKTKLPMFSPTPHDHIPVFCKRETNKSSLDSAIMLTIEPKDWLIFWAHNSISFKVMSFGVHS
jgi:hypothetical protein